MQPILQVDLTQYQFKTIEIPKKWERQFLGGASLAARLLYESLTPELDPLSPAAPLLFLTGPLTGTLGPAVGRFVVCGRSPAIGLWAESNCGGFWGPELRFAGFDGIWITGKSEKPCFLWICDGKYELRDAAPLWGQDTARSRQLVQQELGQPGARVLTIGPAGENGVLYAGMYCDHGRAAGRTGLGAVMGNKNLKAVAVKGSGKPHIADEVRYGELRAALNRGFKDDNQAQVLHDLGTAGVADYSEFIGAMPSKYFHQGTFPAVDKISGSTMTETMLTRRSACHGCVIACGRVVDLKDGMKRKGPEYETVVSFGPNLLIDDLPAIVRLGNMCDQYGMDTISAGGTIGLAFHLFEKGVITTKDTGGLALKWGDAQAVEQLLHWTARRTAFGELLAQGARRLAQHFGVEEEAVQVNGLEMPYHDARALSGMALVYATSPRGACHNQSDYLFVDWGHSEEELDIGFYERQAGAEKAANVARHQDWRTVNNALVMCILATLPPSAYVELINAATGYGMDLEEMMRCGERSWNLKRAINIRLGLTAANDTLPKAVLEAYKDGGSAGFAPDLKAMLAAYYQARQWDGVSGKPSKAKLVELDLAEIAPDL